MINTQRLLIRPWQLFDAPEFLLLTQDVGFTLYPITDYRQKDLISAENWIAQNKFKYAVVEKKTGQIIGMGGLTPWSYQGEEMVDITYRLRQSAWGLGYGFELARALVDYGLNDMGLTEVTATITPDNVASKKIADKLGMKFDQRIELLGVPTDLYRLTRDER